MDRVYRSVLVVLLVAFCVTLYAQTTSHACQTTGDCMAGHCCLSTIHLVGKRQGDPSRTPEGNCSPLGQHNDSCLINDRFVDATRLYYGGKCPCKSNLHCKGNGVMEPPFGEAGNCFAQ